MNNRLTELLKIEIPLIQAGMVWCSGWRLASAVSKTGALGVLGAGTMYPDVLKEHIQKTRKATSRPFAVNVPLLYPDIEDLMEIILAEKVPIVITSAGNPSIWTGHLKNQGCKVVHVVSSVKFAVKAQQSGVDAVVAEGFEAGGHNGREETTTFCLIPMVRDAIDIPLVAAGGVFNGRSMLGAIALGADGVQVGSRFAASEESSAHNDYKQRILSSGEGDTVLTMKSLTPVRLLKNEFYEKIREAEQSGASAEELSLILGKRRAKAGIFEGDLVEGELEIGQVAAAISRVEPAADIVNEIWEDFQRFKKEL